MTRRSPSEFSYMRFVANYAVRFFDCPDCAAGAHEACTMARTGRIVCHARWVLAKAEINSPERREYKQDTIGARRRARAGEPARPPAAIVVPLADANASPAWRYRKLRQFLAGYGVVLAKVKGTDRYRITQDGRRITDSISLAGAESWARLYWQPSEEVVNGSIDSGSADPA